MMFPNGANLMALANNYRILRDEAWRTQRAMEAANAYAAARPTAQTPTHRLCRLLDEMAVERDLWTAFGGYLRYAKHLLAA